MNPQDVYRLALETGASHRTIAKWLKDPDTIHNATAYGLQAAC